MKQSGNCSKCGAPYYTESIWHGITPPPITPSCACWNTPKIITTNSSTTANYNSEVKMSKRSYLEDYHKRNKAETYESFLEKELTRTKDLLEGYKKLLEVNTKLNVSIQEHEDIKKKYGIKESEIRE